MNGDIGDWIFFTLLPLSSWSDRTGMVDLLGLTMTKGKMMEIVYVDLLLNNF